MSVARPDTAVLLLTNPRSGSTWLFDALRAHPAAGMLPRATLFRRLGLKGRRYPRDLSDPEGSWGERVEVRPGCWETIPVFDVPEAEELVSPSVRDNLHAIEKFHPSFYNWDTERFLKRLRRLARRMNVQLIYQVRDPGGSMLSFTRYQERNPDWNPEITRAELPAWTARVYEALLDCRRRHPGPVIEYSQLAEDFPGTLTDLFTLLWPGRDRAEADRDAVLAALLAGATAREKRVTGRGTFLGASAGPAAASDDLLTRHFGSGEAVERCRKAYRELTADRRNPGSA